MAIDHKVAKRLKEYTATAINTSCEVYKKVIASEDDNNIKEGAIEHAIKEWYEFLDYYRENNIFKHRGIHKLRGLNFFSGLEQIYKDESIDVYTKNYIAMMIRQDVLNGATLDTVWGTRWNCEHALRYYFNNPNCFIIENTNQKNSNIFKNGFSSSHWEINDINIKDSPLFTPNSGLINPKGVRLNSNTILKTHNTVVIENNDSSLYSMHFFIKCFDNRSIEECVDIKLIHTEQGTIFQKVYKNDLVHEWENKQEYIKLPSGEYNVEIKGIKSCDFDFFCLFPAVPYPSISVIIGHNRSINSKTMFFAPGNADKVLNDQGELVLAEDIKEGTHKKYKFWFPHEDDTDEKAKEDRKKNQISLDDERWGYWSADGYFISLEYLTILLDVLIPVGIKVFDIALTKQL